jgi:tetratricopeptide (TPR) repeat protein
MSFVRKGVGQKTRKIFCWGIVVVFSAYIGIFGLPGLAGKKDGQVSQQPPTAEQQIQGSYLEQTANELFGQSAAQAGQSEYQEAMELAREGNKLQTEEQYKEALPILENALDEWKDVPNDEIKGKKAGNYAATMSALAGCYVHTTLDAYFLDHDPYPNSIERLKKGKELAQEAIEHYKQAERTAESEEIVDTAHKYASGSFNVLGLANEYLGKLERAEECYKEAIERRDNEDAEFNLKHLGDNYDVFLD